MSKYKCVMPYCARSENATTDVVVPLWDLPGINESVFGGVTPQIFGSNACFEGMILFRNPPSMRKPRFLNKLAATPSKF